MKNSRFQLRYLMGALAVLCVTSACTADLKIPDGIALACENGSECPAGAECKETDDGTAMVCVTDGDSFCGDGIVAGDEACDDGSRNTDSYSGSAQVCNTFCSGLAPYCGDGSRTNDEVCDAGSENSDTYNESLTTRLLCNLTCDGYRAHCGDGVVESDGVEECDDGNTDGGDYCGKDCLSYCGDGVVDGANFETCDDGNGILTDACPDGENGTCRIATCGDGFVFNGGGEDCEPSLEQATCSSIASVYQAGNVSCLDACRFDFSTCFNDPDNMVEGMVYVPPGIFWMGCNEEAESSCAGDEYPYHEVYLDGFYIDTTEVSAGAYKACVDSGNCVYEGSTSGELRTYNNNRDTRPINYVNHTEAKSYCEAQGKRLPTEAEWEKAARGTDGRRFPWGNEEATCDLTAMYGCPGDTRPVGSLSVGASPYGAMDMAGNLFEWTADWYSFSYYAETPAEGWVGPEGPLDGSTRALRGGSFYGSSSNGVRASYRYYGNPDTRDLGTGFRCAQ